VDRCLSQPDAAEVYGWEVKWWARRLRRVMGLLMGLLFTDFHEIKVWGFGGWYWLGTLIRGDDRCGEHV
jgi:hypothetical protein